MFAHIKSSASYDTGRSRQPKTSTELRSPRPRVHFWRSRRATHVQQGDVVFHRASSANAETFLDFLHLLKEKYANRFWYYVKKIDT
ncbi:hypothetical protein MX569_08905 [Anoxybacillus kestanbolensis]|nr:hypothetical protein [Anoxybacillus kestanbolensis]